MDENAREGPQEISHEDAAQSIEAVHLLTEMLLNEGKLREGSHNEIVVSGTVLARGVHYLVDLRFSLTPLPDPVDPALEHPDVYC